MSDTFSDGALNGNFTLETSTKQPMPILRLPEKRLHTEDIIDQKRQQRTYRNRKAGKPGGDIIRLRTLERFTGIDNQRTRQRHLCQAQESALNQTHRHQHLEAHLDVPEGFQIIKNDETDSHTQDGYLAYPIATIALHQIGAEATQKKDAQAISSINHAN